jgi:hypothetical protein
LGNTTTTTNIYDPATNTFSAGPALTAEASAGSHSFQRPDGKFVTILGNTVAVTNIYDPATNAFTAGPALTAAAAMGAFSFQRPDGKFVTILGGFPGSPTTNIYDPATNAFTAGPALTANASFGSHSFQRPDGKFVTILGAETTTTNIYDPATNTFVAGPALTANASFGSHSFQRPDGKFVVILGNTTATVNIIDVGWVLTGTYISEPINSSSLSTNTVLTWKTADSQGKVYAKIRTASSAINLGLASWSDIPYNGAPVNPSGNSWIQVRFDLGGTLSGYQGAQRNVWMSENGGLVAYYRTPSSPTLVSYSLTNRPAGNLLTLNSNNSTIFRFTSEGSAYTGESGAWYSGGADIAEYYQSSEKLEPGEIVVIDENQNNSMVRSTRAYQNTLTGVVSSTPGFVAGAYTEGGYPIALSGRVPVLVSTINGPIKIGDPITSSDIPGVGMSACGRSTEGRKATCQAGPIVGKALEEFKCPVLDTGPINIDSGSGAGMTNCTGKITLFVNLGWYDPDVLLTDSGDLKIISQDATYSGLLAERDNFRSIFKLVNEKTGEIIERIGSFAELIAANIRAGRIETQELISPLANIEEIKTQRISLAEISPATESGNIVINLQLPTESSESSESAFGQLIIKGEEGKDVVSIDASGNASFSGQLTSENLQVNQNATVSGTLYADEIITKHGKFGDLLVNNRQQTTENREETTETATPSSLLSEEEIENLVNEILATAPEATSQAVLAENISLPSTIDHQSLTILGPTSLADTTIAGNLNIGGTLTLADSSINTLGNTLYLQNLGLGGIDILAGKIVIDSSGNLTINGDVTIKGRLAANLISPLPEQDLVISLENTPGVKSEDTPGVMPNEAMNSGFGKLLIKGFNGQTVASVDAIDSAQFNEVDTQDLIIALDNQQSATSNQQSVIETNATAGIAILPANKAEITIKSPFVTENSLIYISPISETKNKVIFVKAKKAGDPPAGEAGWLKVGVDTPVDSEIKFNWWLIN